MNEKEQETKRNYALGVSLAGVIAVALIMLPNIMYLFGMPPNDVLGDNSSSVPFWNALENIGRFGVMATLCFIINKAAPTQNRIVTIAAICLLLAYYGLWFAYFNGMFNGLSLVGMAIFPSAFFLLIAWRQKNSFAIFFALLFAIAHISMTSSNYL